MITILPLKNEGTLKKMIEDLERTIAIPTQLVREHSSITSSKRWVGGVRKWQFLMIYSIVDHQRGGWA